MAETVQRKLDKLDLTTEPLNVAIVGGGFAGFALLIGLQKYPHLNPQLYESAETWSELGAGAIQGPNAQRAMEMIDPRILHGFERRAAYNEGPPDENGQYLWMAVTKGQEPDVGEKVLEYRHSVRGSTIHRAHFLNELIKLAEPERTHVGKRLVGIQESGDEGPVQLHFKDGTQAEADVVIGADGIHSVVRKHVLGTDNPASDAFFTGGIIYRCTVPIAVAKEALEDVTQKFSITCGKDGVVYGFPLANNTLYYIGVTTFHNSPVKQDKWNVPVDTDDLNGRFADYADFVKKQVALVPNDGSTLGWSIWEMPLAPTFHKGRVYIMGDAAHATAPFLGAGAGQAIEDALVMHRLLGHCFDPARQSESPFTKQETVRAVLQACDTTRRFRSQKVVVTSSEVGRLLSGNEPGITMEAAPMFEALKDKMHWIWDADVEQQVKDARLLFEEAEFAVKRQAATRHTNFKAPGRE
uniref:CcxS n=1 Tax=Cochliobolus sativus TaxID=45130 RepID=A0A4D6Q3Z9_COCSA|nr:CcxS [Bipolaris sorokiniana]